VSGDGCASSAFERYHRTVQRWIWNKEFSALRQVQELAAPVLLDTEHDVLIAAPTGQGKSEAAFFPIWSRIVDSPTGSVRVLYIAPLKALINDQYRRQITFCEDAGIPVTPWHGDVAHAAKRKLVKEPSGILLITPESLEALFVRQGSAAASIFRRLDRVVVDELHAFFGSERGRQLQSLLARIELAVGRRVARVGLSATLGDDKLAAAEFLRPGDGNNVELVEAKDGGKELRLGVLAFVAAAPKFAGASEDEDQQSEVDGADFALRDSMYRSLRNGRRHLVFSNRRDLVERYTDMLRRRAEAEGIPNEFFAHHGSLAKELRESVEQRLHEDGRPTIVVCTSTLEMGIDIGDVESVGQIGCPPSVASLRQRLGRSGREDGAPNTLRVYVREPEIDERSTVPDRLRVELFQTLAMVELLVHDKWCEPPAAEAFHFSTLVHQTLSVIAERGGVRADQAWVDLCKNGAFRQVDVRSYMELLRGLAVKQLLMQDDERLLLLTEKGENLVNHYDFYAVFQTGEEYRLVCRGKALGHLPVTQPLSIGLFLIFAGRRWEITGVDDAKKVVDLVPAKGGRPPKFEGAGGALVHDRVRQKMRDIYAAAYVPPYLDRTSKRLLDEGRRTFAELGLAATSIIEEGSRSRWFPWAGDRVVNTWVLALAGRKLRTSTDGVSIEVDRVSPAQLGTVLREVEGDFPTAVGLADSVQNLTVEKYDSVVPRELLVREFAKRMLDVEGARRVAADARW
jgi:ATP-dependent Lhr-like helicase